VADWSVTPQDITQIPTLGWWVDVPTDTPQSLTGWWEVTAQIAVPALIGSATAAMWVPGSITAGARLIPTACSATAAIAVPGVLTVLTVPVASSTTSMPTPTVGGAALVSAELMTAGAAIAYPDYNLNFGGGGGGFPYTFDFELDSTGVPAAFDYTFDFALG
jgi:hypothetical protein